MLTRSFSLQTQLLITIVSLVLVAVVGWLGVIAPIQGWIVQLYRPVTTQLTKWSASLSRPLTAIPVSYNAARKLQQLESDYAASQAEITELKAVQRENQLLREILDVTDRAQDSLISTPLNSFGQPSISAGEADGVVVGQPVLVNQALVGLIEQVDQRQSLVRLLSNLSQPAILVMIDGQDGQVEGIVRGDGRQIIMTELPPSTEVEVGQQVVTVGQNQIRPGILIGEVQYVQSQPTAAVLTVVIKPAGDFYQASVVEVGP